jgi:hypothetical protein
MLDAQQMTEFQTHYLGFPPLVNKNLLLSAAQCQLDNEMYDLSLPGFPSRHGEWIPRSDWIGVSSKNARLNIRRYSSGFERNEWMDAYKGYARYSIERLEQEIAALKSL